MGFSMHFTTFVYTLSYCIVNSQHPRAVSNHASTVWENEKTTRQTHDAVQNPHGTLVTLCGGDVRTTKPYSRLTADQPLVFATDDLIARGLPSYAGSLLSNYIILPRISQNLQSSKFLKSWNVSHHVFNFVNYTHVQKTSDCDIFHRVHGRHSADDLFSA